MAFLFAVVVATAKFAAADKRTAELRLSAVKFFRKLAAEALLLGRDLARLAGSLMTGLLAAVDAAVEQAATALLAAVLGPLGDLTRHKFRLLVAVAFH